MQKLSTSAKQAIIKKVLAKDGRSLAETNEQWQTRCYLDMDEFKEWLLEIESFKANVVEINKMVY